ncbi:hypothetical protein [Chroococcidiopsis sp. CCMEE 29]|uniref:hypothetical protein n=1 Tax=Chroococcidiopsis sp. CCMEE 29 TaxID=155894 RepID=UPI002022526B|nr:hypothetical protein [Chroococcidiopsis sp. CCMEE 29]
MSNFFVTDLLGWVNRLLPSADGIGTGRVQEKDSTSNLLPSGLTALSDIAAQQNNQVTPAESARDLAEGGRQQ